LNRRAPRVYKTLMTGDYLLLASIWGAYCGIHSTLISIPVTNWLKGFLAGRYRFYRLIFNSLSAITLVPVIMFSHSARYQSQPLFRWNGQWRLIRFAVIGLGVTLAVAGARHYSMLQFLGIDQIRKKSGRGAMTSSGNFDESGILGWVRHPWYVAVFLLIWMEDLNAAAITVNVVLSAYLVVGTLLEERKLGVEFGEEYRRYQERVSMFIPIKWLTARRAH
jgi:methanethiol S-methyltransferase